MEYISCNMGTCDLPEIYALSRRLSPHTCVYISGKSLVPMLQNYYIHQVNPSWPWYNYYLKYTGYTKVNATKIILCTF